MSFAENPRNTQDFYAPTPEDIEAINQHLIDAGIIDASLGSQLVWFGNIDNAFFHDVNIQQNGFTINMRFANQDGSRRNVIFEYHKYGNSVGYISLKSSHKSTKSINWDNERSRPTVEIRKARIANFLATKEGASSLVNMQIEEAIIISNDGFALLIFETGEVQEFMVNAGQARLTIGIH